MANSSAQENHMDQVLEDLVASLRKLIAKASAPGLESDDNDRDNGPDTHRALRRVLALLWSAHDEIALLRASGASRPRHA
jgi:hypothetical protein